MSGSSPSGSTPAPESVSFARDISPQFSKWRTQMQWRFDLTDYDAVRANAGRIYHRISSTDSPMPPPQFPRFDASFTAKFKLWMDTGFNP